MKEGASISVILLVMLSAWEARAQTQTQTQTQNEDAEKPIAPTPGSQATQAEGTVRLRGGFSVDVGTLFVPAVAGSGICIGPAAGRVGIQLNQRFSIYYQTLVSAVFLSGDKSGAFSFTDYNSILSGVTIGDVFEVGLGPSIDYVGISACEPGGRCPDERLFTVGGHSRLAFSTGGISGGGPRRSGFVLGADIHSLLFKGEPMLSVAFGIGAEWY